MKLAFSTSIKTHLMTDSAFNEFSDDNNAKRQRIRLPYLSAEKASLITQYISVSGLCQQCILNQVVDHIDQPPRNWLARCTWYLNALCVSTCKNIN